MTKPELIEYNQELLKLINNRDAELESAYQKINELQDNADEIFAKSPHFKQLTRDLENMKAAYESEKHRLEVSQGKVKKLQERLETLEKSASASVVPRHNERNAGRTPKFSDREKEKIVQDYKAGKSMRAVAQINRCSVGLVQKLISERS